jgi:hypothetical protein
MTFEPTKIQFLTDRWGQENEEAELKQADKDAVERLEFALWGEVSFVVRHGDQYGSCSKWSRSANPVWKISRAGRSWRRPAAPSWW